ncbi:MAG: hypothetical protein K2H96_09125 [Muribaculaceae bacterium]|nr:hypothetical protein [Muribaculaceae bacterium]
MVSYHGYASGLTNPEYVKSTHDTVKSQTDVTSPNLLTDTVYDIKEVVVQNERVIKKGNLIELYPGKRDKRFASGGIDVLANMNLPDIRVNPLNNEITSSEGDPITLFIDFQPASNQQMREIRPQEILRIDLLRSPEDPRFGGAKIVANYIMKKYEYGGYSKLDGTQYIPIFSSTYSLYSKFSYKKMTYDISTGIEYNFLKNNSGSESNSIYHLDSEELERVSRTLEYKNRKLSPRVTARAIYNGSRMSFSNMLSFNYSRRKPFEQISNVDFSSIFDGSESFEMCIQYNRSIIWKGNYYVSLPNAWSLNVSSGFDWSANQDNTSYTLTGNPTIVNDISEQILNAYGDLNFTKRFGRHSFRIISAGGWTRNKLEYMSSQTTRMYYREGYVQLGGGVNLQFNNFSIAPSIRISTTSEKVNENAYTRCLPKAFIPLYLQLSHKSTINGSFEFAIGAPDASLRSPVLVRLNEIDAIVGNENLKDYSYYDAKIGYSHYWGNWLSTRIDARMSVEENTFIPVYSLDYSNSAFPMMIRKINNNGNIKKASICTSLSGNYFNNTLSLNLSATMNYYSQNGERKQNKWHPDCWVYASYYISNFKINAYFTPPSRQYSTGFNIKTPLYWFFSASYSYKDLFIDIRFSNPLVKSYVYQKEFYDFGIYQSQQTSFSPSYHQCLKITLSYSIGYGKRINRKDEVGEIEATESIMLKKK